MGNMLLVYKLYPEDIESIAKIEEAVKHVKSGKLKQVKREPIAFGMELVMCAFILPDKVDGVVEKLEAELKRIPHVNEVESAGMTLL